MLSKSEKTKLRKACFKNAKSLLKESRRLSKRGKFALATFLAITSLEESLKLGLLMALDAGTITELQFNDYWNKHKPKLRSGDAWVRVVIEGDGARQEYVLGSPQKAMEIIKTRENCLYVDFRSNSITEPRQINIATASRFINLADSELRSVETLELLGKKILRHLRAKEKTHS